MVCGICLGWMQIHSEDSRWRKCPCCGNTIRIKGALVNLSLVRDEFIADGIFGRLMDARNKVIAHTLEHAYLQDDGSYSPKTPAGTYTCQRGDHLLHGMTNPFSTFEIMNVPGHSGILFHVGNWNADSDGCVLLGDAIVPSSKGQMVTQSKVIFAEFMQLQNGLNSFEVVIS